MALALAVISCVAVGYLLVALGWPVQSSSPYDRLLRASLSLGFGVGAFSLIFFLARVVAFTHFLIIDLVVLALLAAAFWRRRTRSYAVDVQPSAPPNLQLPPWLDRVVVACFALALAAALYSAVLRSIVHPHGDGWDAFAIWNLHARFLFRGGEHWRDGFSSLIPWSHPDYPLLLPSAVAHFWSVLGHETTVVPAVIGLAFTFSTLALLYSSLAVVQGRTIAMLGAIALASTPFFVEQGSSQYADVPVSFFFLAVIVLLQISEEHTAEPSPSCGLLVLAGMAAGFAIWTKNEGMLFLCAIVVAQIIVRSRQWVHRLPIFLAAVAPFVLLVTWFKHSVAFPNELFSNQPTMLHKILDHSRYWAILQWFSKDFVRFGGWWLVPGTLVLLVFHFAVKGKRDAHASHRNYTSVLTLAFMLAGYFAIYVITPYDLYWHLRFSLNRLLLQLWPCAIYLVFLAIVPKVAHKSQIGTKFGEN